jgi:hypothetical protein
VWAAFRRWAMVLSLSMAPPGGAGTLAHARRRGMSLKVQAAVNAAVAGVKVVGGGGGALRCTSGARGAASAFPDAGRANPADRGGRAVAERVQ